MADQAAAALLRGEFSIEAFDMVITAAYHPSNPHRAICNTCLMTLQSQYDTLWIKADSIIEQSTTTQGRFFGLQILMCNYPRIKIVLIVNLTSYLLSASYLFQLK